MYRIEKCRCDECRDYANSTHRDYARKYRERTGKNVYDQYRAPGARKRDAARRRARLMDAFVEDVDPIRVFEADGYRCYGCNLKCIKGAPNNHPLQPTLDHVIPLSKGGTHEYANIRTMCRQCNVRKGDRGGGEQLLLIG
jgi:5-methylcytosine-specific restriction endonuclease McrA